VESLKSETDFIVKRVTEVANEEIKTLRFIINQKELKNDNYRQDHQLMYQHIRRKLEAELKHDFDIKEGRSFRNYTVDLESMQRKLVKYKHLN
jgi:hypothetical protein